MFALTSLSAFRPLSSQKRGFTAGITACRLYHVLFLNYLNVTVCNFRYSTDEIFGIFASGNFETTEV